MRVVILCVMFLVVGLAMGWYCEHERAGSEKASIVEQMLSSGESSDAAHVARAIHAIGLIESGDAQDAVKSLSIPIADYYAHYRNHDAENQRRSKLRAVIEELVRTNTIVARVIKERIQK